MYQLARPYFQTDPIELRQLVVRLILWAKRTDWRNSFIADAPNDASIVEDTKTGELKASVIESFDPVFDTNKNMLTYTITTENATSIDLPGDFGQSI